MFKSITAIFLACLFLTGSTLLPLGDFSLMADLPGMFRAYTGVVKEEPDVLDFIGDYLLNGKELLGHNKHDAPIGTTSGLQFQHQANNSLNVVLVYFGFTHISITDSQCKYPRQGEVDYPSAYQHKLFRPPLA